MKKIIPSIGRSIQWKSNWPGNIQYQQNNLSLTLEGLGIKYQRICNNISVNERDYADLRGINIVAPVVYQRSKSELTGPVLVYLLRHQAKMGENEFVKPKEIIGRLEEIGIFYSIPEEKGLSLYFWIEKNSVIRFRKWNQQQYGDRLGVFFQAVRF